MLDIFIVGVGNNTFRIDSEKTTSVVRFTLSNHQLLVAKLKEAVKLDDIVQSRNKYNLQNIFEKTTWFSNKTTYLTTKSFEEKASLPKKQSLCLTLMSFNSLYSVS